VSTEQNQQAATTRRCPYCQEEIRADATRCKHCRADPGSGSPAHGVGARKAAEPRRALVSDAVPSELQYELYQPTRLFDTVRRIVLDNIQRIAYMAMLSLLVPLVVAAALEGTRFDGPVLTTIQFTLLAACGLSFVIAYFDVLLFGEH
jgi:hypothetical protein